MSANLSAGRKAPFLVFLTMTLSNYHWASCMWLSHWKVTGNQPLLDRLTSFEQRESAAAILGKVKSAGQNCCFHAFWAGSVAWQLTSRDSHFICVCRWLYFHWDCTPEWQPSHNWVLSFSTNCSHGYWFWRHSDWTSTSIAYGCLYLTWTFPPKLSLRFLQVPLVGMIPMSCSRVMVVIMLIIFLVARKGSCCS